MKKAELVGLRYTQLQTNLNIFKFMITMVKNSSCFGKKKSTVLSNKCSLINHISLLTWEPEVKEFTSHFLQLIFRKIQCIEPAPYLPFSHMKVHNIVIYLITACSYQYYNIFIQCTLGLFLHFCMFIRCRVRLIHFFLTSGQQLVSQECGDCV